MGHRRRAQSPVGLVAHWESRQAHAADSGAPAESGAVAEKRRAAAAGVVLLDAKEKAETNGFVAEANFIRGIAILLRGSQGEKMDLSFRAYGGGEPVSKQAILDVFDRSWTLAWQFLAAKVGPNGPPEEDLKAIANAERKGMLEKVAAQIDDANSRCGRPLTAPLDRRAFSLWANVDRTVKVECGRDSVQLAMTFMHIERKPDTAYPSLDAPTLATTGYPKVP